MPEIAFVNGRFSPLAEAVVPIEDRGFQFADGVYEVVATYGGRPFALEPHLERLERSMAALNIPLDLRAYGLQTALMDGWSRAVLARRWSIFRSRAGSPPGAMNFPLLRSSPP